MQPTRYAIRYTIYDIRYTSYANRLSSPAYQPRTEPVLSVAEGNNELLISIVNPVTYVSIRHHYKCSGITTNVMISLQIILFMQNKAKFRKVKLNVNKVLTKDYENIAINIEDPAFRGRNQSQFKANFTQNKANSNPIQTQTKPISKRPK